MSKYLAFVLPSTGNYFASETISFFFITYYSLPCYRLLASDSYSIQWYTPW